MELKPKRQSPTPSITTTPRIQRQPHKVTPASPRVALQREVTAFTSTAHAGQKQAAQPVFQANTLQRQEEQRIDAQREPLQRQAAQLSAALPANAIQSALQRQAAEQTPIQTPARPQSSGDWVTVMRAHAQSMTAKNNNSGLNSREVQHLTTLQRQTAHVLAQNVKTSLAPATQRHAEFAQHAVTLQRHPLTSAIPRAALNMVTPGERPMLQRAVDEATQADALQRQQDEQALQLHSLQRQLAELDEQATQPVMQRIQERRGAGNPLPESVQRHLEQGLNHDLSGVRIHDDAEADKMAKGVNAIAFTTGKDIFFQSGKFDPNTQTGMELLAHEVTHTVQQSKGQVGKGIDPDSGLEQEARNMGRKLATSPKKMSGQPRTPLLIKSTPQAGTLQRKPSPTQQNSAVTIESVISALDMLSRQNVKVGARDTSYGGQAARTLEAITKQKSEDAAFWRTVQQTFEKKYGAGRIEAVFRNLPPAFQQRLSFAFLGGTKAVTYAAFLNQLAFMSYSNDPELADTKLIAARPGKSVKDQASSILDAAGYEAMPTVQGLWGFQMRVFKPKKGAKNPVSTKTIVAFRGTEGVVMGAPFNLPVMLKRVGKVNQSADSQKLNESFLDSMTDFAPYPTGYSQYEANEQQVINPVLKSLKGSLVAVGHSLGGALAQIATAKNPGRFSEVHTFQGAKIEKADVEKATQANKNIAANHYSINGDVVPGSGEASMPGQFHKFNRAGGLIPSGQTPDAVGGHNNPIMIEMLRQFTQAGIMGKSNPLVAALAQNGSRDPLGKVTLSPTYDGTKGHINNEGAKQVVVGSILQNNSFAAVIQNNMAYNIYAERAMTALRGRKANNVEQLMGILDDVFTKITDQPLTHTTISHTHLNSILKIDSRTTAVKTAIASNVKGQAQAAYGPTSYTPTAQAELQRMLHSLKDLQDLSKIDPTVLAENKNRLKLSLIDLWYTVNPEQVDLYKQAVGQ